MLEPARVEKVFANCLAREDDPDGKVFEGIVTRALFTDKIEEHRAEIEAMLMELPHNFRRSVGGGWSFLNGCVDSSGDLWTGEQRIVEYLVLLGMGIGKVSILLPRELWAVLPGGVPYFVIEDVAGITEERLVQETGEMEIN